MRLGILLDRLDGVPGGAEAHTLALARRALAAGDEVVLATLCGRVPGGAETILVRAPRRRPARDETFAQEGARRLREAGCKVVFAIRHALECDVYMPHGGLVDDARAAKDAAAGGAGPLARLGRAFSRKQAFFREAERALLAGAGGPTVIAVADDLALRIQRRYPGCAQRVVTVRNGVDADRFQRGPFAEAGRALRARWGLEGALVGLLLARHPVLKGVETAVRALAEPALEACARPFHLLVAGGPLPGGLRRLARRLGVTGRLHAQPAVDDPRPLYAAADLLAHPTWHDPCSLVCLEALAMGLPVVTTVRNGVHEVMRRRGGRVLAGPGDPAALARALAELTADDLRAQAAVEARAVACENPAADRLDRVLALCRSADPRG